MVRQQIEIAKCDLCGSEEGVEEVTITMGGRTVRVDLCSDDAGPLAPMMDVGEEVKGGKVGRKSSKAPARPAGHAVVAIEDFMPESQPEPEPEPPTRDVESELIEAARPLVGTTTISAKVALALGGLMSAAESGVGRDSARLAVVNLNPQRVKIPDTEAGRRLREALVSFREQHGAEK